MNRLDKLWWYDQQWEYCDEIKKPNIIYIKISQHFKKDYKVNYIPFLMPRVVFDINKTNLITGKPLEKILMPVILTNER